MATTATLIRASLILWLLVSGWGCSLQFAYNNLDRFARWGVNDYLRMTDEQRRNFDSEFSHLHYWHRTEHLPKYASFVEALPSVIAAGVDEQTMLAMETTAMDWADEVVLAGVPMATELLASLSDEQVAQLAVNMETSNEEIAEPELGRSVEESQARWTDEVAEFFSNFAGRVTADQRHYVRRQSVRYVPERVLWADYRRRWQAELLRLLDQRDDRESFRSRFAVLATSRESYYGTEFAAVFERNQALSREVGAWLLNNLTERQRERLFDRLRNLAQDMRELSGERPRRLPERGCLVTC